MQDISVTGNTVSRAGKDGIRVVGAQRVAVTGNQVSLSQQNGIKVAFGSAKVNVVGNAVFNNDQAAVGAAGIYINDSSIGSVVGNFCYDDQGGPTQEYGIRADGTSGDWLVTNNV